MNWIDVKDKMPEILEDGISENVLCFGIKGNYPNDISKAVYEVMCYKELEPEEQIIYKPNGTKVKYGWSNRWWDLNQDLYIVTHWAYLTPPKQLCFAPT